MKHFWEFSICLKYPAKSKGYSFYRDDRWANSLGWRRFIQRQITKKKWRWSAPSVKVLHFFDAWLMPLPGLWYLFCYKRSRKDVLISFQDWWQGISLLTKKKSLAKSQINLERIFYSSMIFFPQKISSPVASGCNVVFPCFRFLSLPWLLFTTTIYDPRKWKTSLKDTHSWGKWSK